MAGLVLEGGCFRGIFSAGVMDALLDHDVTFDYVIGVSAGISNGVSYISKQKERNMEVMRKYRNDKRYMSKRNFLKYKSLFDMDFVFDEIPNKLIPFDWDSYMQFDGTVKIGITDAITGKIEYQDGKILDKECTLFRATCALPILFPPITIKGTQYYDGGLSDSIPIKQSLLDGNEKNLVILTQPQGFVKKQSKLIELSSIFYKNKFPGMTKMLLKRPQVYNDTLRYLNSMLKEQPENIVVIQPEYPIASFESDVTALEQMYYHGYEIGVKNMEKIKKLFI